MINMFNKIGEIGIITKESIPICLRVLERKNKYYIKIILKNNQESLILHLDEFENVFNNAYKFQNKVIKKKLTGFHQHYIHRTNKFRHIDFKVNSDNFKLLVHYKNKLLSRIESTKDTLEKMLDVIRWDDFFEKLNKLKMKSEKGNSVANLGLTTLKFETIPNGEQPQQRDTESL